MKPIDAKKDSFAEYNEESNEKDTKFKVSGRGRISNYKNIFAKKIKNTVPWIYVISDLNGKEIVGSFYEKQNCRKLIRKNLELKE